MLALPFLIWLGNPFPIWSGESYKEPIPSSKCKRFVFEPSMLQETVNLVKASHYGAQKNFSLHPQIVYRNCINTNQKYTAPIFSWKVGRSLQFVCWRTFLTSLGFGYLLKQILYSSWKLGIDMVYQNQTTNAVEWVSDILRIRTSSNPVSDCPPTAAWKQMPLQALVFISCTAPARCWSIGVALVST